LFRAEEGTLTAGQAIEATFQRGTVDVGDEVALVAWSHFFEVPAAGQMQVPSLRFIVHEGRPGGGLPMGVGMDPADLSPFHGILTIGPLGRSLYLSGRGPWNELYGLAAHGGKSLTSLGVSPPRLLGVERLARSLGWPVATIPADLDGVVGLTDDAGAQSVTLEGAGTLDLAEAARALGLPNCSGTVTLTIEKLDLNSGMNAGGSRGTLSVALAGSGPAQVDPLALEVFRYIFFGQLSDRAVEEDVYTLDHIAFTVTLAGDRVTVTGEDGPLLSGRSQRGYAIELTGPAQATTEELARRVRLALGGLSASGGSEVGEGAASPPAPDSR
jgi:hypothetical protein